MVAAVAGKLLPSINLELFAWAVCFPITDHALFSGELFFYPSKNYLFIFTQLFENLKGKRSSDKYYFCMQFVMHVLFD